MFFLIKASNKI